MSATKNPESILGSLSSLFGGAISEATQEGGNFFEKFLSGSLKGFADMIFGKAKS